MISAFYIIFIPIFSVFFSSIFLIQSFLIVWFFNLIKKFQIKLKFSFFIYLALTIFLMSISRIEILKESLPIYISIACIAFSSDAFSKFIPKYQIKLFITPYKISGC